MTHHRRDPGIKLPPYQEIDLEAAAHAADVPRQFLLPMIITSFSEHVVAEYTPDPASLAQWPRKNPPRGTYRYFPQGHVSLTLERGGKQQGATLGLQVRDPQAFAYIKGLWDRYMAAIASGTEETHFRRLRPRARLYIEFLEPEESALASPDGAGNADGDAS